jgi:hypothetical protein
MKTKNFTLLLLLGSTSVFAQPWQTVIGNAVPPGAFLGTTNNQPLNFRTNNIQRMTILGGGPTDGGFIGINTNNPQFRLHINADNTGFATAQGWRKGILLSNDGALMWQGNPSPGGSTGTSWNYFMAHASNSPVGDFYQGMSQGIGSNAPVVYSSKVYASSNFNNNPQGTAQS